MTATSTPQHPVRPDEPGDGRLREDVVREIAARHGVPVNPVEFAADPPAAARAAERAGGPVAIKLVADDVVHKSKAGGVLLQVQPDRVHHAVTDLLARQRARGVQVSGVTVDPGTEAVVGALHDPGHGPVVMVGSGGVDVEALGDVAFALAPLGRTEATRLLDRTRLGTILRRRDAAAHRALVDLLVCVGGTDGMLLTEPIDQIDLNPVVIGSSGVVAVDARAMHRPDGEGVLGTLPDPETVYEQLRPAIYPASITVLGASADPRKLGNRALRQAIDFGFAGPLYPVSRSSEEILGHPTVADAEELPRGIDRAVLALPSAAVPGALRTLATRGTRTAHVLTADTVDLGEVVADLPIRVLGPNCIGHYSPSTGLTMVGPKSSGAETGSVALISQSGTYASDAVRRGAELGLRYSFVSSVGSCHDVSPSELLAFCEADPRTSVAAFYLEGDADASRFLRLAARISTPVIVLKGGRSAAGGAAAASHTGAMAGDPQVSRDVAEAAGVVLVDTIEELLDTLLVAQYVTDGFGDGLGLVGSGGGVAVLGADAAHERGLRLSALGPSTLASLERFRAPGTSIVNPVDLPVWSLYDEDGPFTGGLVEAVAPDPAVDSLCVFLDVGSFYDMDDHPTVAELVRSLTVSALEAERGGVPMVLVLRSGLSAEQDELTRRLRTEAARHGVPVIDTVDRVIAALAKVREARRVRGSRTTPS